MGDKVISEGKQGFDWEGCRLSLFPRHIEGNIPEAGDVCTCEAPAAGTQCDTHTLLAFPAMLQLKWDGKKQ